MRMLLIMAVTLYTSRIILNTLGVEDFGIYNVVGGVISMLGFLNSSLGGASSRFITFSLGKNDKKELRKVFYGCFYTSYSCCCYHSIGRDARIMVCLS